MSTIPTASYAQPLQYEVADPRLVAMARLLRLGMMLYCIGSLIVMSSPVVMEIASRVITISGLGGTPIGYYSNPLRSIPATIGVVLWGVSIALLRSLSPAASIFIRFGAAAMVVMSALSTVGYLLAVGPASANATFLLQSALSLGGTLVLAIGVSVIASPKLLFADRA